MGEHRQGSVWKTVLLAIVLGAICAALAGSDLKRIRTRETGDFVHFYLAADAVRHHADPYAAGTRGYIYPPLLAFLYQPLTYLGQTRASAVMLGVSIGVTLLALFLASDEFLTHFQIRREWFAVVAVVLLALVMNSDKVKGEWQMWQTDIFMLLLFVLGLRWLDRRPILAGIALGLAVNIKYLPLLFLPYLLIRRRWKVSTSLLVSTVAFALLPALGTGWNANARNWGTATDGLFRMAGLRVAGSEAAEIHPLTDALSCSITSAWARGTKASGSTALAFGLAAATALLALLIAALMYRRFRVPMLGRNKNEDGGSRIEDGKNASAPSSILHPPSSLSSAAIVGVEWSVLLAAVLAFSPQTNTRHLFDALLLTVPAAALLLFRRPGVNRLPLLIGCLILIGGFTLPPGSRTNPRLHAAALHWLMWGGPCWSLLVMSLTLLWTGLATTSAIQAESLPHPLPSSQQSSSGV
jgi:hypothetical protein